MTQDKPDAPGHSDRTEQHATGQRGPHREAGDDTIGRGRTAGANSPLSPKPQAERGDDGEHDEAPEKRPSPDGQP